MNAVDTNILVYIHDDRDSRKQRIAAALVDSLEDGVLLWQVSCEYLNVMMRLRATDALMPEGWAEIRRLRRKWRSVETRELMIDTAEGLLARYSLSFWDSLIVAACLHAGGSGFTPRISTPIHE